MREAYEVLRTYADESSARAVDVCNKHEGDREDKRQDQGKDTFYPGHVNGIVKVEAEHDIADDGDLKHQAPGREGNAVPPGGLGIAL